MSRYLLPPGPVPGITLGIGLVLFPSLTAIPYSWLLAWCLIVSATWESAWLWSQRACADKPWVYRLLVALILFEIIASSIVAYTGFFHTLTLAVELVAASGLLLLSLLLLNKPVDNRLASLRLPGLAGDPVAAAGLVTAGLACAIMAFNHVRHPTADADNMWYHLPMIAEWMRNGSIWPTADSPIRQLVAIGYPGFREAVMTFVSLPVGNEHLGVIGAIEPALVWLSLYLLVRHFSDSVVFAVAAATYGATTPMVATATKGNDLALAIAVNCSVLFLLDFVKKPRSPSAVVAGLALGMVGAMKYSGAVIAPLVLATVLAGHATNVMARGPDNVYRLGIRQVICLAGCAIGVALPWYLRNMILWENPLYPAEVKIAGVTLLNGPLTAESLKPSTLGWEIGPLLANVAHLREAFGWLIPLISGALLWAVIAAVRSKRDGRMLVTLGILGAVLFVAFLHQPYNKPGFAFNSSMRFLMPWFAVNVGVTASAFSRGKLTRRVLGAAFLLGAVANVAEWTHYWWLVVAGAGLTGSAWILVKWRGGELVIGREISRWGGVAAWGALAVLAAGVDRHAEGLRYRESESSLGWGGVCSFVHRNLQGERIVVCGREMFFPLYGDKFTNAVFLVCSEGSTSEVMEACRRLRPGYIVAFVPTVGRAGLTDYSYGSSIGPMLVKEFPEEVSVEYSNNGAYVLRVREAVTTGGSERGP